MKQDNYMQLEIPSYSSNEFFARGAVACFISQLDPTIEELSDIKTAVSEAVTNCIVHAYPEEIGKILINASIETDQTIHITIQDFGCGIADIEKAREPMFTTGGADRSGMGITIMESFMHTVTITSVLGEGTTVHMCRKLTKRGPVIE